MGPVTEFRTLPVSAEEPADRTMEGTAAGDGGSIDLGTVDTTDEAQDIPVLVLWWRVTDMQGFSEISNIRVWISGMDGYEGNDAWYMDITDAWTRNKTPVQVMTGSPGTAPLDEPDANIERMGGGPITGTLHGETTRYIYISGSIGINETTGIKDGLRLTVKYDYK